MTYANPTLLHSITKQAARAFVRNHFAYGIGGAPSLNIAEMGKIVGVEVELRRWPTGGGQYMVTEAHYAAQRAMQVRARALEARYLRFAHHMRDRRHAWQRTGEERFWADNSRDVQERSSLTGETRWVQTVPPHGDVCF